jgi:hypothetical protein
MATDGKLDNNPTHMEIFFMVRDVQDYADALSEQTIPQLQRRAPGSITETDIDDFLIALLAIDSVVATSMARITDYEEAYPLRREAALRYYADGGEYLVRGVTTADAKFTRIEVAASAAKFDRGVKTYNERLSIIMGNVRGTVDDARRQVVEHVRSIVDSAVSEAVEASTARDGVVEARIRALVAGEEYVRAMDATDFDSMVREASRVLEFVSPLDLGSTKTALRGVWVSMRKAIETMSQHVAASMARHNGWRAFGGWPLDPLASGLGNDLDAIKQAADSAIKTAGERVKKGEAALGAQIAATAATMRDRFDAVLLGDIQQRRRGQQRHVNSARLAVDKLVAAARSLTKDSPVTEFLVCCVSLRQFDDRKTVVLGDDVDKLKVVRERADMASQLGRRNGVGPLVSDEVMREINDTTSRGAVAADMDALTKQVEGVRRMLGDLGVGLLRSSISDGLNLVEAACEKVPRVLRLMRRATDLACADDPGAEEAAETATRAREEVDDVVVAAIDTASFPEREVLVAAKATARADMGTVLEIEARFETIMARAKDANRAIIHGLEDMIAAGVTSTGAATNKRERGIAAERMCASLCASAAFGVGTAPTALGTDIAQPVLPALMMTATPCTDEMPDIAYTAMFANVGAGIGAPPVPPVTTTVIGPRLPAGALREMPPHAPLGGCRLLPHNRAAARSIERYTALKHRLIARAVYAARPDTRYPVLADYRCFPPLKPVIDAMTLRAVERLSALTDFGTRARRHARRPRKARVTDFAVGEAALRDLVCMMAVFPPRCTRLYEVLAAHSQRLFSLPVAGKDARKFEPSYRAALEEERRAAVLFFLRSISAFILPDAAHELIEPVAADRCALYFLYATLPPAVDKHIGVAGREQAAALAIALKPNADVASRRVLSLCKDRLHRIKLECRKSLHRIHKAVPPEPLVDGGVYTDENASIRMFDLHAALASLSLSATSAERTRVTKGYEALFASLSEGWTSAATRMLCAQVEAGEGGDDVRARPRMYATVGGLDGDIDNETDMAVLAGHHHRYKQLMADPTRLTDQQRMCLQLLIDSLVQGGHAFSVVDAALPMNDIEPLFETEC